MSERQKETTFLRHAILHDDSDEHRKLEKNIAQVQRDERCVQRVAWVMDRLLLLALAGFAYGVLLDENFPHNGSELFFKVLCEVALASLFCLVGFAVQLMIYRRKLMRLRQKCVQLAAGFLPPVIPSGGTWWAGRGDAAPIKLGGGEIQQEIAERTEIGHHRPGLREHG